MLISPAMLALLPLLLPALAAASPKVSVDLYVMSLCPFGVKAENTLIPAVRSLEGAAELRLHFIARERPGADGQAAFSSLHGEPEVQEDLRQVCARELRPDRYLDYILERNKDYKSEDWRTPARAAGLDPAKLDACAFGAQGRALLRKDLEANAARAAAGSPTIDIDGKPYEGQRGTGAFTLALCEAMRAQGARLPKACAAAPALAAAEKSAAPEGGCGDGGPSGGAAAFDIRVVVESGCPHCEPTLATNLKRLHPGAALRLVGHDSDEGKELIARHAATTLPLYVLGRGVEQDPSFSRLLPVAYYRSGDDYLIKTGPTNYYPSVQLARKAGHRHLDVFVEPLSDVSIRGERELAAFLVENVARLKDLTFSFHFLVKEAIPDAGARREDGKASLAELGSAPGKLWSRHGPAEVEESLRQACLFQHAGIGTFFTYLACRNEDPHDARRWDKCAAPSERVKACIGGKEGSELLRRDARLARELGIDREPVLLWRDRYGPYGFNEVDWKAILLAPRAGAGDAR